MLFLIIICSAFVYKSKFDYNINMYCVQNNRLHFTNTVYSHEVSVRVVKLMSYKINICF